MPTSVSSKTKKMLLFPNSQETLQFVQGSSQFPEEAEEFDLPLNSLCPQALACMKDG